MKTLKSTVFLLLFIASALSIRAQRTTDVISSRALLYADSMISAFAAGELNKYIDMSYPGVVSYYGGMNTYSNFVQRAFQMHPGSADSNKTELLQVVKTNRKEWQSLVRKTTETIIDNKKAFVISYMVGRSENNGASWRYVDVALNPVENLVFIMPDISAELLVPKRQIIFTDDQVAGVLR